MKFGQFFDKIILDWVLDGVLFDQLWVEFAKNFQLLSDNSFLLKFFPFCGSECLFGFGATFLLLYFECRLFQHTFASGLKSYSAE
jgi:hypothetical protein